MQYFTCIYQKAKAAVHIEILNAIPFFCCQVDVERKPSSFLFSSRILFIITSSAKFSKHTKLYSPVIKTVYSSVFHYTQYI